MSTTVVQTRPHPTHHRRRGAPLLVAAVALAIVGASLPAGGATTTRKTTKATKATPKPTTKPAETPTTVKLKSGKLRLGFFPNVTHAPALVGVEKGLYSAALGPDVKLETYSFNAGPAAVEALFSGAIDAAYVGPNPAATAFARSKGKAIRIIAGSTSGGAFLVVKPGINSVADLKGKKLATPQLGGTQDIALRYFLKSKGLSSTVEGGGDVSILPQENAQTLETFRAGGIDGAWVPEPWATRLVAEAGARVLVDERDLWPKQSFTTTILIVRTDFLKDRPDIVEALLQGHVAAVDFTVNNPTKAQDAANSQIEKLTGKKLAASVISNSWVNLTFTNDPEISTIKVGAQHATDVGLLDKTDLTGIEDLTLLNKVLAAAGKPTVSD